MTQDRTVSFVLGALALVAATVLAAEKPDPVPRKTAIFVDNRADARYNERVLFLEDQIASRLASKDFRVISREDVLRALKVYPVTQSEDKGKDENLSANRNALGTKADRILSDNTSALRLAQNMGADFILFANIGSVATEEKVFKDASIGVDIRTIVITLRGTWKMLEGVTGGALAGGPISESKNYRQTENFETKRDDVLSALLESAAEKIVIAVQDRANDFQRPDTQGFVEITISCAAKDLEGREISLPDIRVGEDNKIIRVDQRLPLQVAATLEVDGFAKGTTPLKTKVAPGPHKLRLTRPGFTALELSIIAENGLEINPAMQLSQEGFNRWKEIRGFLNELDGRREINKAVAEDIRGHAQMLRQSGMLVDFRVNTKDAPKIIMNRSIYSTE